MKKDLNFVASLEKEISKKYGEIAITNPKNNWSVEKEEKYLKESSKLAKKHNNILDKSKLIKKTNNICIICNKYSFQSDDNMYLLKFETCYKCYIEHIEGREEKWLTKKE